MLRWFLNGFALWISASLLSGVDYEPGDVFVTFILAGLVLTLVNAVLKPILLILSLPAVVLSLGLFTLVINGVLVWVAGLIVPGLQIGFGESIIAGIIVSIINFLFTMLVEYNWEGSAKNK